MSDHIPREVMSNILLRLGAKDLVTCRRVSKQWLSIIDDPHFISRQLEGALSTNTNSALFLQDKNSPTLYWKQKWVGRSSFFSQPIHREPGPVLLMGSCHGLVCFALLNYPYDFVILNPSTGERHTLSNPSKEGKADDKLKGYGFGYDELSDDYKVVRILETRSDRHNGSYIAEIYGVRSKGFFRTIPLPTADWTNYDRKFIGVFVGSSLHWCTRHSGNTVPDHVLHAIDLGSNTYRQQQLPETCFHQAWLLNAGSVDKRLCVSGFLKEEKKIGMWVIEEYWNLESWNRIYCVPYVIDRRVCPMAVTSVGSNVDKILLLVNNEILAWFDPDADETVSLRIDKKFRHKSHEAIYCLESLVKIFPNEVKKDAYDKQLKIIANDQETPQRNSNRTFLSTDLRNLEALMYEDTSD